MIFSLQIQSLQKELDNENLKAEKSCFISDQTRQNTISRLLDTGQLNETSGIKNNVRHNVKEYELENYLLNESFQACFDFQTDSLLLKLVEVIYHTYDLIYLSIN